jgi:hypothetical protein
MNPTDAEKEGRRRQLEAIKKLDDSELLMAYAYGYKNPNLDWGDPVVKVVIDTRLATRIAEGTKAIAEITKASRTELTRLVDSSDRLEGLTKTLKHLTWVLIVLTVLAVVVPIGIEIWHAYHEPQTVPVSAPLKQEP